MALSNKPNFTQPLAGITSVAEVKITVATNCGAVYVSETTATKAMLFRGTVAGSAQQPVLPGTLYRIPGPFYPGDVAGTFELSSPGDSGYLNIVELQS